MIYVLVVLCVVQAGTTLAFVWAFRGMRRALEGLGAELARDREAAPRQELEGAAAGPHPRDYVEGFSRAVAVARASDGVLPSSQRR